MLLVLVKLESKSPMQYEEWVEEDSVANMISRWLIVNSEVNRKIGIHCCHVPR